MTVRKRSHTCKDQRTALTINDALLTATQTVQAEELEEEEEEKCDLESGLEILEIGSLPNVNGGFNERYDDLPLTSIKDQEIEDPLHAIGDAENESVNMMEGDLNM
eukprot:CAMPEP_0198271962 /NCGR_PEP_ID=MMETSP1447-20131203/51232_1 /TAXON_ID=420782 /ORGANISM="Chaetoceros dichaeta, Strain CCMP1751" /LENGTH=105 /DNA_ID=CAMNT_0043964853 /DNA_START=413 /DNA_END=730 /DNA_ORIENTATION=-